MASCHQRRGAVGRTAARDAPPGRAAPAGPPHVPAGSLFFVGRREGRRGASPPDQEILSGWQRPGTGGIDGGRARGRGLSRRAGRPRPAGGGLPASRRYLRRRTTYLRAARARTVERGGCRTRTAVTSGDGPGRRGHRPVYLAESRLTPGFSPAEPTKRINTARHLSEQTRDKEDMWSDMEYHMQLGSVTAGRPCI